jgi:hypothetical protein
LPPASTVLEPAFAAASKADGTLWRLSDAAFADRARGQWKCDTASSGGPEGNGHVDIASIPPREGTATSRFIVTNLKVRNARVLYEDVYCRRGQAENHIKSWKTHLAADRTSCTKATANQLRLFLHAGAYWLMWGLSASMPRRSMWRVAQFDTLRLRLIKVAARVVEMKTMIRVQLPTSCPAQDILRLALGRIPRLVT